MKRISKRLPAGERRHQILEVATELFAQNGFQGVTTKQIAERARVNEAILFRHFPSKKELYWAVIEAKTLQRPATEVLEKQLEEAGDVRTAFLAVATGFLERNTKDISLMRLLIFSGLEEHELSERFFETYAAGFYEMLASYIRRRIRAGKLRKADPLLAARSFLGMIVYHLMVQELFGGKKYQQFKTETVAETVTDIWLEGMAK
jgi:AcrR family transcriptional regulator